MKKFFLYAFCGTGLMFSVGQIKTASAIKRTVSLQEKRRITEEFINLCLKKAPFMVAAASKELTNSDIVELIQITKLPLVKKVFLTALKSVNKGPIKDTLLKTLTSKDIIKFVILLDKPVCQKLMKRVYPKIRSSLNKIMHQVQGVFATLNK